MKTLPRCRFIAVLSMLVLLVLVANEKGQTTEKSATLATSTKIQIAFPSPTVSTLPMRMALNRGFYLREGLEVELAQVNPSVSVAGVVSGKVDYVTPLLTAIKAAIQGDAHSSCEHRFAQVHALSCCQAGNK